MGITETKYFAHRVAPPECSPRLGGSATKRVPDWVAPPKFPPDWVAARLPNLGKILVSIPNLRRGVSEISAGWVAPRNIWPRLGRHAANRTQIG